MKMHMGLLNKSESTNRFIEMKARFLKIGMGLFLIAASICLVNGLFLPFAYEINHFPRIIVWGSFAGITAVIWRLFNRIDQINIEKADIIADRLSYIYICALFAVYLLLGYWMEYTPSGDNFMLYQASQTLAKHGRFEPGSDFLLYFGRYSNQWGFLLLLTGIYKVLFVLGIQNTFYPLVIIQAVMYAFAIRSLYRVAGCFAGGKGKLRLTVILVFCLPMILAATVLYTDTFSMPFIVFMLETSLRVIEADSARKRIGWAVLSGIMAFLGTQIKMTVLIVLMAASIIWLLRLPIRHAVISVVTAVGLVIVGLGAVHQYMLNNILDTKVYAQEHTPIIHWIMMSIPSADNPYGGYYSRDYAITWGMMDEGADQKEVMDSIYSRMKDKIYTLRYPNRLILAMLRKNSASMNDGTFGMTEMLDDRPVRWNLISEIVLEPGRWYRIYGAVTTGIWMSQLFLGIIGIRGAFKKHRFNQEIICVACLGIVLFLLIWEARSRYLFGYIPLFLLLSALSGCDEGGIINQV